MGVRYRACALLGIRMVNPSGANTVYENDVSLSERPWLADHSMAELVPSIGASRSW
jgi:hypothetical protein